uniref:Uncharacterized protein n=1 Tax=Nelumbo nucifera TaxID=4432 RepID=A0A822Y4C0_NELNU|nr:TPA_asm: hypothetical protein HUJ06_028858 [Nelumbo nucifera]
MLPWLLVHELGVGTSFRISYPSSHERKIQKEGAREERKNEPKRTETIHTYDHPKETQLPKLSAQ